MKNKNRLMSVAAQVNFIKVGSLIPEAGQSELRQAINRTNQNSNKKHVTCAKREKRARIRISFHFSPDCRRNGGRFFSQSTDALLQSQSKLNHSQTEVYWKTTNNIILTRFLRNAGQNSRSVRSLAEPELLIRPRPP